MKPFSTASPAPSPRGASQLHPGQKRHSFGTLPMAAVLWVGRALLWLGLATVFGLVEAIVFVAERGARFSRPAPAAPAPDTITHPNS